MPGTDSRQRRRNGSTRRTGRSVQQMDESHSSEIPRFADFDNNNDVSSSSMNLSDVYDFNAAQDHKWAKHAASGMKDASPERTQKESQSNVRRPKAGLIRSASRSRDVHNSNRSITPIQKHSNGSKLPQAPSHSIKIRETSLSPRHYQHEGSKGRNQPIITSSSRVRKSSTKRPSEQKRKIEEYYAKKNYTFQKPTELVTFREIDLSSRTAFEPTKPITTSDLTRALDNRSVGGSSSNTIDHLKKVSPSPQHLDILDFMRNLSSVRQLCWSTSIRRESDPFHGWDEEIINKVDEVSNERQNDEIRMEQNRKRRLAKKREKIAATRAGYYRQINPIDYIKSTLPDHAPLLTNVRRRLPNRSDVRFQKPKEEEILMKQAEIAKEAELEEISPRLVVMLSSANEALKISKTDTKSLSPNVSSNLLPGIPFAGKELLKVIHKNQLMLSSRVDEIARSKQNASTLKSDLNKSKKKETTINPLKPNLHSIFAPPMDSTSSSTETWRARPFTDRPSGMVSVVAVPLNVRFAVGDIEPLICTLSLYDLGPEKSRQGKISEDFVFPAGEWEGILKEEAGERLARQFGIQKDEHHTGNESHLNPRAKKALFSYDPLAVQTQDGKNENKSLYVVMQVDKVTQRDAATSYLNHASSADTKKGAMNSFSGLIFGNKLNTNQMNDEDLNGMANRAKALDGFDTQFLTPLCFGVLPVFQHDISEDMSWPQGMAQLMRLYSHSPLTESEDGFISCLRKVIDSTPTTEHVIESLPNAVSGIYSDSFEGIDLNDSYSFQSTSSISTTASSKNQNKSSRLQNMSRKSRFRKKKSKLPTLNGKLDDDNFLIDGCALFKGSAVIFTSVTGVDFTKVLLYDPDILDEKVGDNPRLLVDTSGDCAIMVNPKHSRSTVKKRSNLIRLPPSSKASGYSDSSEAREVLFLPVNGDHRYDGVSLPDTNTTLNFLYLYPRVLRQTEKEVGTRSQQRTPKNHTYSVRIQLVQQEVKVDKNTGIMETIYIPTESIYNPAPSTSPLIRAVYTKVPLGATLKNSVVDMDQGLYMRDQVKIRLPIALDGSHFIQLSLFVIEFKEHLGGEDNGGRLAQTLITDTLIPLSSSSGAKESTFGTRVTTVIPNGLYRIKMGEFQLQLETRLATTVHVSDPAVATIIRDFDTSHHKESTQNGAISYFQNILSKASEQAIASHFLPLVFLHFRYLASNSTLTFDHGKHIPQGHAFKILMAKAMRSLFEVLRKARKKFQLDNSSEQLQKCFKDFFDLFDDVHFSNKLQEHGLTTSSSSSFEFQYDTGDIESKPSKYHDSDKQYDSNTIVEATRKRAGLSIRLSKDGGKIRKEPAMISEMVPFTRKAYGASKIDRMKAEAELYESGQVLTELVDDDETVVTVSTWQSHSRAISSGNSVSTFDRNHWTSETDRIERNTASHSRDTAHHNNDEPEHETEHASSNTTPFEKARSMAQRVNSVAQVFIAPCVAPNLAMPFNDSAIRTPVRKKLSRYRGDRKLDDKRNANIEKKKNLGDKAEEVQVIHGGSDIEEEDRQTHVRATNFSPYPNAAPGARLRGHHKGRFCEIIFSIPDEPKNGTTLSTSSHYLYEIIFSLWVHSHESKDNIAAEDSKDFVRNMDFFLPVCLKSMTLRCLNMRNSLELVPKNVLDQKHIRILGSLIECIAHDLLALSGRSIRNVTHTLSLSDSVLDFFEGLLAFVHPSQVAWLTFRYLKTLRDNETSTENLSQKERKEVFDYIYCSRQLRLRTVEHLSSIPRFVALNFPLKYSAYQDKGRNIPTSWTNQVLIGDSKSSHLLPDRCPRLPEAHWLAELLSNECFMVCSQACEAVVTGFQVKGPGGTRKKQSSIRQRIKLTEEELHRHQSLANHSITIAYELLLRAHATDSRYQSEIAQSRVAGMFVVPVIENAIQATAWLTKMDSSDKVRTMWLLCVLYILQEAPEVALRKQFRSICIDEAPTKEKKIIQFIEILKLSTSTFQNFANNFNQPPQSSFIHELSPWLIQESFNTISAAAILLVDECCSFMSQNPLEQRLLVENILDLILHIISAPLSSVTLLRALGAASHTLDNVGAALFLEVVGDNLQHWGRMLFSLMNSTSLSVRSMAVDLKVSLFGRTFAEKGSVDQLALIFLTILPEVIGREIALYNIDGHIKSIESIETSLWPLRRSLAEVEETDPHDDDRVDPQLSPFLCQICRTCQAIIDGVLIELRLEGEHCKVLDTKIEMPPGSKSWGLVNQSSPMQWTFDADEESLFEAANFFLPETSPMQRVRWLLTLKRLHEFKGQWVEAGETLILCAKTMAEAIPHVHHMWIPSKFPLWHESVQSPWLTSLGEGKNQCSNAHLMKFAENFLEPPMMTSFLGLNKDGSKTEESRKADITSFSKMVTILSKEALIKFDAEGNMNALASLRFEEILKIVISFTEGHTHFAFGSNDSQFGLRSYRDLNVEQNVALKKMCANINELVTKMAERMLLLTSGGEEDFKAKLSLNLSPWAKNMSESIDETNSVYVRLLLLGKKTERFQESTTIPTFLDWEAPYICRVSQSCLSKAMSSSGLAQFAKTKLIGEKEERHRIEHAICRTFAEPYLSALCKELSSKKVKFSTEIPDQETLRGKDAVFLIATLAHQGGRKERGGLSSNSIQWKKFTFRSEQNGPRDNEPAHFVEVTVAQKFPCPLSRQPMLLATEFVSANH